MGMEEQSAAMFPDETKKVLSDTFKQLNNVVEIEVYLSKESNEFNKATTVLLTAISELTDKIKVRFLTLDSNEAKQKGITRSPTILVSPDRFRISYVGAPVGEEIGRASCRERVYENV
jgi:thioredoxin reductase (NADPH)